MSQQEQQTSQANLFSTSQANLLQKPSEMDYLLHAVNEVIHADLVSKHSVEVSQIDKITRHVKGKGEQCRDLLRYISNLRKSFIDCLG